MPISRRVLDDDEEVLVDLRLHWAFLAGPVVLTAVAVAVAIAVAVEFPGAPVAVAGILGVMVAVPVLWLAGRVLRWLGISLVVTTDRIIYRRGILGRDVIQLRLQRVAEVHYTQTVVDRVIGSGRLVVELVGDQPMVVDDVRRPRALQRVLTRQLDELSRDAAYPAPPPGSGVPTMPISVPRPLSVDDTPPHGYLPGATPTLQTVHPDVAPTLATSPTYAGPVGREVPAAPAGAAAAAPGPSIPEQLIQLDELRRRGIISDGEFAAKKTELLSRL